MPLHASAIEPLNVIAKSLPEPSHISVMIDHPGQLQLLERFSQAPHVFLKLDTGLHRAGLPPDSGAFSTLVAATIEAMHRGKCSLQGLYSHASQSYAVTDPERAMDALSDELRGCQVASAVVQKHMQGTYPLVLSAGATPTATAARNLVANASASASPSAQQLRTLLRQLQADERHTVELHAGVYPFLDLQQISTQAAPSAAAKAETAASAATARQRSESRGLDCTDVAFTVLTEVASVYAERAPPQVLVTAGSLALGREACPRYTGFGAVRAVPEDVTSSHLANGWAGAGRAGWVVGKISQEHGLLVPEQAAGWEGSASNDEAAGKIEVPFSLGQRLHIIPNHACIAAAGFPWYYVVDGGDEIVDIWVRCQGWHCVER